MKKTILTLFLVQILFMATSFNFVLPEKVKRSENIAMCSNISINKNLVLEKNEKFEKLGTCYGYINCTACTNCSRCNYCNSGGSCGVCSNVNRYTAPKSSNSKSKNEKNNTSEKPLTQSKIKEAIKYNDDKYTYLDKVTIERGLKTLGYDVGDIDGIFDKNTIQAIRQFQKDYGLTPDGKIGKKTILKIKSLFD